MPQLAANVVVAQRFRLNRQLGRGGMGAVWHASDLRLDKACAVKFIEGEFASMPEAQSRFQREAKAAAALNSPHVVTIYDHGVWDGTPYIAMELLEGEDLGKRLSRVGRISPQECVEVLTQVQRALTKAHAAGIVHRDLKPDNIYLVREDDERELAKVLDFGIAKSASSALDGSNTKTGAMLGTPYYMSPEQAQGIKAVDHRSDLWSLGVIVFQILTGRLPFESEALGDLLVKIIVAPPPMPSHLVNDLPSGLDEWWTKASQRDPNHRFQTAKELVDELRIALGLGQHPHEVTARQSYVQSPGGPNGTVGLRQSGGGFAQSGGGFQQSGAGYRQNTPQPGYGSSQPGYGPPQQGFSSQGGFQPTTGAPVAGTFSGQNVVPKTSRTGLFVGIAAGALVLGVVGVVAMKSGGSAPAAGAGGTTSATPTATTPSAATAAAQPSATAAEPPSVVATTAAPPTSIATAPAATVATIKSPPHGGAAHPAEAPHAEPKPSQQGPKKPDLGF